MAKTYNAPTILKSVGTCEKKSVVVASFDGGEPMVLFSNGFKAVALKTPEECAAVAALIAEAGVALAAAGTKAVVRRGRKPKAEAKPAKAEAPKAKRGRPAKAKPEAKAA